MSRHADETNLAFLLLAQQVIQYAVFRQHPLDVLTADVVDVAEVDVIGFQQSQRSAQRFLGFGGIVRPDLGDEE